MALIDEVKTAMRISHTALDSELTANIIEARAEMRRVGISAATASDDSNPLVKAAIKAYCKYINAPDTKTAEGYEKSWLYQLENLRKSTL